MTLYYKNRRYCADYHMDRVTGYPYDEGYQILNEFADYVASLMPEFVQKLGKQGVADAEIIFGRQSIENVPARYGFDKSKMIWKDLNEGRVRGFYVFFDYKDGEFSNIRLQ